MMQIPRSSRCKRSYAGKCGLPFCHVEDGDSTVFNPALNSVRSILATEVIGHAAPHLYVVISLARRLACTF